jgi:hypothetical protein
MYALKENASDDMKSRFSTGKVRAGISMADPAGTLITFSHPCAAAQYEHILLE